MPDYHIGFVMEQTLGHVTHDRNLRPWVAADSAVRAEWLPIPFDASDRWQSAPGVRTNWTLRASLRARDAVRTLLRLGPIDALFYHTQVTALFARRYMHTIPAIVSLDATPRNVDTMARAYDHSPSKSGAVERLKDRLNARALQSATGLITWSEWAKRSLIEDYGIAPNRVAVIPPGVDLARWKADRGEAASGGKTRLLFVGADFRRKGGDILLKAFQDGLSDSCELDIVTRDPIETGGAAGIRVHNGLTANSPELQGLFRAAQIFVFPTYGDCLPIAVMEAMASGLPVVATGVGAISEEVTDGVNGLIVAPGDSAALKSAVASIARDETIRREMGKAGRSIAAERFDAACNYPRVLRIIQGCIDAGR